MRTQLYLAALAAAAAAGCTEPVTVSSASAASLDTKAYPYGYSGMSNVGKMNVTDYPAGTLVVDVVDAKTNQLVWRGQGMNRMPNNSDEFSRQIAAAVRAIVAQFPQATRQAA
jgi:Domain of unknown function (DUF4136)